MAKQVTMHLWGDSHLLPRHHVPDILKERTGKHYVRYRNIAVNHAKSGQKMTVDYAKEMIDYIKRHDAEPILHVLQIGSNDVWAKPTEETVEGVRALVADIANKVLKSKGSALVVTSPIPGDKPEASALFEKLHLELKEEIKKVGPNKKVTHADFLCRFTKLDKDGSRYDPKLWEDHRHLNKDGAARFVSTLLDHVRTLPIAIFGLKKASRMTPGQKGKGKKTVGTQNPGKGGPPPKPRGQGTNGRGGRRPVRDLAHKLTRGYRGPQDLRGQLGRPAPRQDFGQSGSSGPSGQVAPTDLLNRPVPVVHRYTGDGLPMPVLPVPIQPVASPWQALFEAEQRRKQQIEDEDPVRIAYEALKAENDAREEARRRQNQN